MSGRRVCKGAVNLSAGQPELSDCAFREQLLPSRRFKQIGLDGCLLGIKILNESQLARDLSTIRP